MGLTKPPVDCPHCKSTFFFKQVGWDPDIMDEQGQVRCQSCFQLFRARYWIKTVRVETFWQTMKRWFWTQPIKFVTKERFWYSQ